MSDVITCPAPDLTPSVPPPSKWDRERAAFYRQLPELLQAHRDKYVAVHNEQIVAVGDELIPVALKAYDSFGYQEIYVGKVTCDPSAVERIPRYRDISNIERR